MKMKTILIAMATVAVMASCASGNKVAQGGTLSGEWSIVNVGGNKVSATSETKPFIGFGEDGRVYGSAGCNRMMGSVTADAKTGDIDFSALGCTKMMCPDMTTEDAVLKAIGQAKKYHVKDSKLTISDGNGQVLMTLEKK